MEIQDNQKHDKRNNKNYFLSIILPIYNEVEVLPLTLARLDSTFVGFHHSVELLIIDDGSSDDSVSVAAKFNLENMSMRIISMQGNQGHMYALTAGMEAANGEWIASLDADLQDPPELLLQMIEMTKFGKCDVIQAVRSSREKDSLFKRLTADLFYKWMDFLIPEKTIPQGADFRLINKKVKDFLLSLPERNRVYRLLIINFGFEIRTIEFKREVRAAGNTKYPLHKMIKMAVDSTVSFSTRPLRLISTVGFLGSILMVIAAIGLVILKLFTPTISGWASIVFLILAINSLILAAIGVVGEYVGRIFEQVQGRPTALWRETFRNEILREMD